MASQSLYRKHRPQRFSELVGQEHVTTALCNAVREDRVGHAYLFSGPRGTGKTTTARLFAKALNCLALGDDGEPCNKCENCLAVAEGTFYDLQELDAASHNGVDSVRELIQNVNLGLGASSKRKVYVVDEVHMLTPAASNALLKTLEEPPGHVVFILATTDPQKVMPTIRSRTQHFEFTLLGRDLLVGLMHEVLEREGIAADDEALELVAQRGAGSARDALSVLDQALAVGGGHIDAAQVAGALGGAPFDARMRVLEAAAAEDVAGVLEGVHALLIQGHDPRRIGDDLLRTFRDAFLHANAGDRIPYDGPADELGPLSELAQAMGNAGLVRALDVLGGAIVDIRSREVADPRLALEIALLRVARRDTRTPVEALVERVERLERQVQGGAPIATAGAAPSAAPTEAKAVEPPAVASEPRPAPKSASGGGHLHARESPTAVEKPAPEKADDGPEAAPADTAASTAASDEPPSDAGSFTLDDVVEAWPVALSMLSAPLRAAVEWAQPIEVDGALVIFGVPKVRFDAINARFRAEAETIKQAFSAKLGATPAFKLRPHEFDSPDASGQPMGVAEVAGMAEAPDAARPEGATDEPPLEDPDDIDLADLQDASDAPQLDPIARLAADFGAEIVDERPRN